MKETEREGERGRDSENDKGSINLIESEREREISSGKWE